MAKKPKTDTEQPEGAEGSAAKTGRKKGLIWGALGAVMLAVVGGGGYFFFGRGGDDAAAAKKPAAFLDIREMVVNLAPEPNQDRVRLLKFRVSLEIRDAKVMAEIQPLLPRVEDAFQALVRELRPSELEGSGGLYRLREELLRRVNIAVYPAKVDAVLFKEVVVQ